MGWAEENGKALLPMCVLDLALLSIALGNGFPGGPLSVPPLLDAEGKLCISADWQTPKKGSLLLELTQLVNLGPVKEKRRKTKTPPKAIHKERS